MVFIFKKDIVFNVRQSRPNYQLVSFSRNIIIMSISQSFPLLTGAHEPQLRTRQPYIIYYIIIMLVNVRSTGLDTIRTHYRVYHNIICLLPDNNNSFINIAVQVENAISKIPFGIHRKRWLLGLRNGDLQVKNIPTTLLSYLSLFIYCVITYYLPSYFNLIFSILSIRNRNSSLNN